MRDLGAMQKNFLKKWNFYLTESLLLHYITDKKYTVFGIFRDTKHIQCIKKLFIITVKEKTYEHPSKCFAVR